jgi:hypothetical protein
MQSIRWGLEKARIVTSRHRASYSTSHNVPNGNRLIVVVLGRDEVQKLIVWCINFVGQWHKIDDYMQWTTGEGRNVDTVAKYFVGTFGVYSTTSGGEISLLVYY